MASKARCAHPAQNRQIRCRGSGDFFACWCCRPKPREASAKRPPLKPPSASTGCTLRRILPRFALAGLYPFELLLLACPVQKHIHILPRHLQRDNIIALLFESVIKPTLFFVEYGVFFFEGLYCRNLFFALSSS